MKKLIYISFVFAFLLAFTSCEKEVIEPNGDQVFVGDSGTRGAGDEDKDGGITDPDEDEDFDEDGDEGIVDPDEDEDFDEDKDGK